MGHQLLKAAWSAAQDKKAKDLVFIDMAGRSDLCDHQILCSGDTDKQTRAICDAIEESCRTACKISPSAIEGRGSGHWILLDYGSLMIHIFVSEHRDFYALESLWPGAQNELPGE